MGERLRVDAVERVGVTVEDSVDMPVVEGVVISASILFDVFVYK